MDRPDFTTVAEVPGGNATADQLSILHTRYYLAGRYADGKDVLEVACGAGQGLGYIACHARRVVGGDIDDRLLAIARQTYEGNDKVDLTKLDAKDLQFSDEPLDTLVLFEAISSSRTRVSSSEKRCECSVPAGSC